MTPIDLHIHELHVSTRLVDGVLGLVITGTADATSESALNTLLTRLHAEMQRVGAREARVNMCGLEFMNSSCFKAFISWIVAADRLAPDRRYRIRFIHNSAVHWQKRSLRAMVHFGGNIVSVETG